MYTILSFVSLYLLFISKVIESHTTTTNCLKWRQTGNCDPSGNRIPSSDEQCDTLISKRRSGYCECTGSESSSGSSTIYNRAMEVTCDHFDFKCNNACEKSHNANLDVPLDYEYVTCGAALKLVHEMSRYRLHSHDIAYGTGSKQQSVTGHGSRDDVNGFWLVKEAHDEVPCVIGHRINCGSIVRLEHVSTRRNLHSHDFKSPLSKKGEVSCFGVAGDGDIGDDWILQCEDTKQCDINSKCEVDDLWKRESFVRLKNKQTGKYLHSSISSRFDDSNCPRCPINGQLEMSTVKDAIDETLWFAAEGLYISPTD